MDTSEQELKTHQYGIVVYLFIHVLGLKQLKKY